jgi:hypothetical protein
MGNTLATAAGCSAGGLLDCNMAGAVAIAQQEAECEDEYLYNDDEGQGYGQRRKQQHQRDPSVPHLIASSEESNSVVTAGANSSSNKLNQHQLNTSTHNLTRHDTSITNAGPWVTHEDRSQMDPLPPASEFDTRPSTRDLIHHHRHNIAQVKRNLEQRCQLYHPKRHDELWILRYLLSQKTVKKAADCAKLFIEYRAERSLDTVDLRAHPPSSNCVQHAGVRTYFDCLEEDAMTFSLPDPDRGIVILAKLAGFHQSKLIKAIPNDNEDWPFWYFMEWSFQVLDSITRKTGRLTKGIRLVDLQGYSLHQNDRHHVQRSTDNAKQVQDQYPQMLASVFLVNAPSWMNMAFRIFRPLLPKRFVEKFDILPKNSTKRLLAHLRLEHVPVRFGGTYELWPYPNRIIAASFDDNDGTTPPSSDDGGEPFLEMEESVMGSVIGSVVSGAEDISVADKIAAQRAQTPVLSTSKETIKEATYAAKSPVPPKKVPLTAMTTPGVKKVKRKKRRISLLGKKTDPAPKMAAQPVIDI